MGDDTEWMKLPTDEKCVHKAWKARVAGYEESAKQFNILDEKSPEFSKYLGILKKMVIDSNAIAQEKALDSVLAYVTNAHVAWKATSEVCNGVITKCLNASRAKTREKGIEIIMMYIEIEKQEIVQEELIKGLGNKQPKVVVGCIQCLREGLRDFGNKIILIKPMIKQLQPILEHREKTVREEAKLLVVEIYRWIGAALKPQLSNLKPVMLTELEGEFEKIPPGKVQQTRFLRSQQDLKEKMEAQAAAGDGEDAEMDDAPQEEAIDPYELMTPVEILSKIPKDYWDKIEAKKWQERKEALEAVQKLLENPCLEKGEYGDLMRTLRKVIAKDTNVMLVTIAAKCIHGLASGLRKKFASYAVECLDAMLEKFREKKITAVMALREACDSSFQATTLEAISETCVAYLDHKTPSVKAETALFLARCFSKSTPTTLPKKLLKFLITPLLKLINDSTPAVRDAAYAALGTAMKVVGEKPMMAFLADVDPLKMAKIKESCEKAEVVGQKSKPASAPAAPAASKPAAAKAPEKKTVTRPGTAPAKQAGGNKKKVMGGGGKPKKGAAKEDSAPVENTLSDDAVEIKAGAILPEDCVKSLASSNWKERLASMEKIAEIVKPMSKADIPCQALVRTITRKPGLKETNFQVLKLKVELIGFLAQNASFSNCTADFCLTELVDKVGDIKNGASVQETLSCIAEACGLEFVSTQVINYALEQKNPKNQSESFTWLAGAIRDFGFKVNVKAMVENMKKGLSATNPAVRTATINALTAMYLHMGAPLRMLFDGEKPALLQQIDAAFEKVQGQKPAAPTRGLKGSSGAVAEEEEEDGEEEGAEGVNVADLVPRTDISGQLTEDLMTEMADKNWKVRNEALQKVTNILKEAKFITPSLGPLPESLKLRLADSNKILVTTTLTICTTLATAVGPNIKQHVRILGLGIVMCFGDSKPQVRKAARECLDAWVDQGGLVAFVEAEAFSEALIKENPFLRADLLAWLAEKLPSAKKLPKEEMCLCVPQVFSCLEDRNGDVRKKAQEVLMPLMIHTGYDTMFKQAAKVKAASKDQVVAHLEKARAELPAKPVKSKPAARPATAAAPVAAAASYDDDDDDEPAAAPVKSAPKGKGGKGIKKPTKAPPTSASLKKKAMEEEDTGPALKVSNGKDVRFKDEKTLKVLKWNFTAPRGEFLDQLRTQMEPTFSKALTEQLFHSDFKQHIKALDALNKAIDTAADATIANLDLLLKWITLRFFDTNTTVLMKCMEYTQTLFRCLDQNEYHLQELEASAFIPYLVNKVGDPKENIRKNIRNILKLICKVFPACKMFSFIIDGLKSKNARQRTECLDELGVLIEGYGINVCQPSPAQALKLIAHQISDRDNSVRTSALNTIVVAYLILGETTYKYIGNLNDKDLGMLEERIKRSSKQKPPSAALAGPPQQTRLSPSEEKKNPPRKGKRSVAPEDLPQRAPPQAKRFLDLEEDEQTDYEMPKLIQMDLSDLLSEPIVMPTAKTKRSGGATVKMLSLSNDVKLSLDMVISHIGSTDIQTSLESLNQVDELLKNDEKREVLMAHVDQLLVVCAMQMRVTHTKHMGDANTDPSSIVALYKNIIGVLLALLQCSTLASAASPDVLKDLVFNLITILLDSRLAALEEGPQVGRAVNVLVVKIVNKCDPTSIMSALIHLLKESLDSETASAKFLDVIMKCLWRSMRILPNIIDDMDLDVIIGDLHQFLVAFPSHTWKRRSNDTPLRTIKTILHTLARIRGNRILNHLSLVTLPCEVEAYLRKVLDSSTNNNSSSAPESNGVELRAGKKDPSKSTKRISKSMHDILAEIFKKIGSKENTREGLNDLYDFKSKYPSADLDPFLTKCSQFFRDYIERGLKNIEMERHGKMKAFSSTPNMTTSDSSNSLSGLSSADDNADPAMYIERLKLLRARCGLDNAQLEKEPGDLKKGVPGTLLGSKSIDGAGSNSSISSTSSNGMPNLNVITLEESATNSSSSDMNPQMLADIRKRLDRIKNRQT